MDEIDLYFKAFNGTNEICKIVSNYANKIAGELKKTEKSIWKNLNNPNSKRMLDMGFKIEANRQKK